MPSTFEALSILLVLLPGFLCARIVQSLFVRPQQTELDKIVEALLYSFLVYVAFVFTFPDARLSHLRSVELLVLACYSVGLGLLMSAILTNDLFGRLLRRIKITQRTSHTAVWNDTFRSCGGYVLVELIDGRMVLGWVRYFSDDDQQLSLFLEDAAWIDRDGTRIHIDGAGILLTHTSGIRNVMFVDGSIERPSELARETSTSGS